jgi:putative membrane protein
MMLNATPLSLPAFVAASPARALGPRLLAVQLPDLAGVLLTTVIFTVFGLLVFGLAYLIIVKSSPFSIRKEIEDDQNIALAVIIGSVIIGVSLIIAAAVHG